MTKKELRKIYLERRSGLSNQEKNKLDDLLLIQFQKLQLPLIQNLFTYYPLATKHEPETEHITRYLEFIFPGLEIAIPKIDVNSGEMKAITINDETIYGLNAYGIVEPVNDSEIDPLMIDCVIVPLLAVDKDGFRVGFGKGYYDKFLAQCSEDIITIGLNYFEPVEKIDDRNAFDVPLKYCITPEKLYEF